MMIAEDTTFGYQWEEHDWWCSFEYGNFRFVISELVWWDTDYVFEIQIQHHLFDKEWAMFYEKFRTKEWAKSFVRTFIYEELK